MGLVFSLAKLIAVTDFSDKSQKRWLVYSTNSISNFELTHIVPKNSSLVQF